MALLKAEETFAALRKSPLLKMNFVLKAQKATAKGESGRPARSLPLTHEQVIEVHLASYSGG